MAASGAKVLMLRCVEYARRYGVPVHVRSSYSDHDGTIVQGSMEDLTMEQALITGVAHERGEAKVTVTAVPDHPGVAAKIFRTIADAEIDIDMVVQNISRAAEGKTDITFTLPKADGPTRGGGAERAQGRHRVRPDRLQRPRRQGVADRRRHALAPRGDGDLLRGTGRAPE